MSWISSSNVGPLELGAAETLIGLTWNYCPRFVTNQIDDYGFLVLWSQKFKQSKEVFNEWRQRAAQLPFRRNVPSLKAVQAALPGDRINKFKMEEWADDRRGRKKSRTERRVETNWMDVEAGSPSPNASKHIQSKVGRASPAPKPKPAGQFIEVMLELLMSMGIPSLNIAKWNFCLYWNMSM